MQTLEQVPIPLVGPGLVNKTSDTYGPGEYKEFTNLVITPEGTLKKRRPVQGLFGYLATPLTEKCVGSWGSDVVLANYDYPTNEPYLYRSRRVYGTSEGTYYLNLLPGLPAGLKANIDGQTAFAGTRAYYIEGLLQYNNLSYAIILATNKVVAGANITYSMRTFVVQGTFAAQNPDASSALVLNATATPVESANISETYTTADFNAVPIFPVVSHFIHKERFVIVSRDTVYFSKATDPTKFLVADDGAFFKFPGKLIKKVVPVNDLLYVIFDNSVSVITYNTSPNTDAQIKQISDGIGGEDAVLYGDTVYLLSYKYIYALNGTNLTKIVDLDIFLRSTFGYTPGTQHDNLGAGASPSLKLNVWDDGIYFYLRKLKFGSSTGSIFHVHPVAFGEMYRFDLNLGYISKYTFGYTDRVCKIADSATTRPSVRNSNDRFYLMSKNEALTQFDVFYFNKNQTFCPFPSGVVEADNYGIDAYTHTDNTTQNCMIIPVELTLPNFSPEGLRYMYRKFRSLQIQADLSSLTVVGNNLGAELELNVSAGLPATLGGAAPYTDQYFISEPLFELEATRHVGSYRYGINQRAKDLTVNIKTRDAVKVTFNSMDIYNDVNGSKVLQASLLEFVNLALIWSETNRGPTNYNKDRA